MSKKNGNGPKTESELRKKISDNEFEYDEISEIMNLTLEDLKRASDECMKKATELTEELDKEKK